MSILGDEDFEKYIDEVVQEKRRYDLCFISHLKEDKKQLQQRIDKAMEYCDRYLLLDLELFDSYELLKKVKEILGGKENGL